MKSVTVEQVMDWHPCPTYNEGLVRELFAGRETLAPDDIATLDIPIDDKLWVLLRPFYLPDKALHLLACDIAEHVVHLCGDDPRPAAAIAAKRAWVAGEISDDELAAARASAWDAAWAAAWAAAGDAAWDAAGDAARAAERKWQLKKLSEYLEA